MRESALSDPHGGPDEQTWPLASRACTASKKKVLDTGEEGKVTTLKNSQLFFSRRILQTVVMSLIKSKYPELSLAYGRSAS